MNLLFVILQVLLLIVSLPLLATSLRTSRSRRTRHSGYMAMATLLALLAIIVSLLSLASSADDPFFDHALAFTPPAFTIGLCVWVVWRALGVASQQTSRHRRGVSRAS